MRGHFILLSACVACQPAPDRGPSSTGGGSDWTADEVGADCFAVVEVDPRDNDHVRSLDVYLFDAASGHVLDVLRRRGPTLDDEPSEHTWYVLGPNGWLEEHTSHTGGDDADWVRVVTRDDQGRLLTEHAFDPSDTQSDGVRYAWAYTERGDFLQREGPFWVEHYSYLPDGRRDRIDVDLDLDGTDDLGWVYRWAAPAPSRDAVIETWEDGVDITVGTDTESWDTQGHLLAMTSDRDDDGVPESSVTQAWNAQGLPIRRASEHSAVASLDQTLWTRGADGRILEESQTYFEGGVQKHATRSTWHWSTDPDCTWIPTPVVVVDGSRTYRP